MITVAYSYLKVFEMPRLQARPGCAKDSQKSWCSRSIAKRRDFNLLYKVSHGTQIRNWKLYKEEKDGLIHELMRPN